MNNVETSADLLDPGDRVPRSDSVIGNDSAEISESQVRQFLEVDMEDVGATDSSNSHHYDGAFGSVGRKRKAQTEHSEQDTSPNDLRLKRPAIVDDRCASGSFGEEQESDLRRASTAQAVKMPGPCVLLIRPADESSKKMLTSPETLCEALEADPFSSVSISDVRVNRRTGVLAIEMAASARPLLNNLLQVTQLGKWKVICSLPNRDKYCYGVIGPVDLDSNLEALSRRVSVQGSVKFLRMERLTRSVNGVKQPSTSLRMIFEGSELPRNVKIGYHSYSVRKYSFPPLQCFHCQRFGHSAQGCTSPRRCLLCAGNHHFSTCQSSERCCANCGGDHKANSPGCVRAPRLAERLQPRSVAVGGEYVRGSGVWVSRPSQMSASSAMGVGRSPALSQPSRRGGSGRVIRSMEVSADVHHCLNSPVPGRLPSPAYSQVVAGRSQSPGGFVGFSPPSSHSLSLAPDAVRQSYPAVPSDFLSNLSNFLVDLFSLSLHKESASKTRSLIGAAVQKHFGVALPSMSNLVPDAALDADLPESPGPGSVCSAGEDLSACLGVDNFQLVSDSEISMGGDGEVSGRVTSALSSGEGGSVLPKKVVSSVKGTSPTPSPVLGSTRRNGKHGPASAASASVKKSVKGSASGVGRTRPRSNTRK